VSIWRYVFDSELRQREDIEQLRRRAEITRRHARIRSADVKERLDALEDEVGELGLLVRALIETLRAGGAVDAEALAAAMHRIDAADGVVDGRAGKPPPEAPDPPPAPVRRRRRS
jgi:hypothetical protein